MSNMLSRDESVEQLDFALKSAGMGVYSWDLLEGIMRWDTQMYALFGLEPGSFSGKYNDFLALVDSGDRPRLAQEIAAGLDKWRATLGLHYIFVFAFIIGASF